MHLYLVLIAVVGSIAITYPKLFHPIVVKLIWGYKPKSSLHKDGKPQHPKEIADFIHHEIPNMGGGGRPHPGMRMSEGVNQPTVGPGGARSGMMTMVLPIYAIGVVLYLVYTMVKVFGGNSKKNRERKKEAFLKDHYRDFHYDVNRKEFTMGHTAMGEEDVDEEDENSDKKAHSFIPPFIRDKYGKPNDRSKPANQHKQNPTQRPTSVYPPNNDDDLETLLQKVSSNNITEREMVGLRSKLEETEKQMTQILSAMQNVEQFNAEQLRSVKEKWMTSEQQEDVDKDDLQEYENDDSSQEEADDSCYDGEIDDDEDEQDSDTIESNAGPRHRTVPIIQS